MEWIAFALGSAVFAGVTSVLAKCGLGQTDSTVATAIRTCVVLVMAWGIVLATGAQAGIAEISARTWLFLVVSGVCTGASWLCYFKALKLGDVSRVVPVDKSSIVLTVLFACLFLGEPATSGVVLGIALVAAGTYLMIDPTPRADGSATPRAWLLFAVLSAVFAALTSIFGKVGIEGLDSNLGTAIRTAVVLVMAWLMVAVQGKGVQVRRVPRGDMLFLVLSGLTTGASWLCFYHALQTGPASIVVPIDKLSIVVSVALAYLVLRERASARSAIGLAIIVTGTLLMLLWT